MTRPRTGRRSNRVYIHCRRKRFSSPKQRPDELWAPHSRLFKVHLGLLPQGKSGWGVKLPFTSTWCQYSEYVELYLHSTVHLHVVLNSSQGNVAYGDRPIIKGGLNRLNIVSNGGFWCCGVVSSISATTALVMLILHSGGRGHG